MTIPIFWPPSWTAALVNHLWQSTVVAGAAWLLTLALRKNHARVRYWVWMVASVKFLLPFSLLVTAGEWLRSLVAVPATQPAIAAAMAQITQPFPQEDFFGTVGVAVAAHHVHLLPVLLVAVWACGALIVVIRFVRAWWRVFRAKRAAMPLELTADVPVLGSKAPVEPGIFGIFRPVLLLPEGILQKLTSAQLDAIIAHEMCHVQRCDNLTYAVHMLVETLFWFHPLVWWIGARLIEERERACDEAVVQSGGEARVYAEGILNVCKFYTELPLPCVSGVTGSDLKQRIVRIMTRHSAFQLTWRKKLLLGSVALVAAVVPVVVGLAQDMVPDWQKLAGDKMEFEVASIHPGAPGESRGTLFPLDAGDSSIPPGGLFRAKMQLIVYIEFAYKIWPTPEQANRLAEEMPNWARSEIFVIEARASGNPTKDQMRLMLQSLLAERFNLRVHFDNRDTSVFALVVAKPGNLGPNLRQHSEGPPCDAKVNPLGNGSLSTVPTVYPLICNVYAASQMSDGQVLIGVRNATMPEIAGFLGIAPAAQQGRPIVDETGLKGMFDITLHYAKEPNPAPAPEGDVQPNELAGPTFPEALQDQTGLKLKATNAPVRTLVIDRVEQPTPN